MVIIPLGFTLLIFIAVLGAQLTAKLIKQSYLDIPAFKGFRRQVLYQGNLRMGVGMLLVKPA